MIDRKFGRIVLIASDALWKPSPPDFLSYLATKGSVIGVVRALASELGEHGISVTAVAPGLTETPMSLRVASVDQFDEVVAGQAMKRRLTPADTASAVAFLASEGAEAVTGQVLTTNGGLSMQ
jgi:NAD(P)-dependent dehydrogenase (short-subunit alcohol dehydrogenase family)